MKNGLIKILTGASVSAMLLLSGCGSKGNMTYDKMIGKMISATIYTSTQTTALTAKGNIAFKDMTDAVIKDLENAKNAYGIDLTYGADGQLDIMLMSSLVSDGKISYSNNFNTQNFTSSQESIASLINGYLSKHTSKSEAYVDLSTGVAMARVDDDEDFTEIPYDPEIDNSLIKTDELVPIISLVADTVGKDKAVITPTETGYTMGFDLALNYEILSKVPNNYRSLIEKDGVSYDNILSVMKAIDNGSYSFPVHIGVTLLSQNDGYLITEFSVSGEMMLGFDKSYDELIALGLAENTINEIPEDYRFGVTGDIDLQVEYRSSFGFQPTEIFTDNSVPTS